MLSSLRKRSRSVIIYVFFGIIIAFFVVNFGPQSAGCTASSAPTVGTVVGKQISLNDFQYVMSIMGLTRSGIPENQLNYYKGVLMDRFLVRELLAKQAMDRGLQVPDSEVHDMLLKGRYLALGEPKALHGENEALDYDRLKQIVRHGWGVSVKKFINQQRRELLAEKMRDVLRLATKAAADEVKRDYQHRNTQVKLAYVRFPAGEFRAKVKLEAADIDAYIKNSEKDLKKAYAKQRLNYTKLPPQAKVRLISVKFKADDADSKKKADDKIKALKARIDKGEDFATVAAESDHPTKSNGGLLGWRTEARPAIGKTPDKWVKKLKDGAVSEVIIDGNRFVLLKVEARRKGDIPFEKVKRELAEKELKDSKANALAKAAADSFIAKAKGGSKLSDLFTEAVKPDAAKDAALLQGKVDAKKDEGKKDEGKKDEGKDAKDAPAVAKSPRKLQHTPMFSRSFEATIPGIGIAKKLMREAFKAKKGDMLGEPFTVNKTVIIAQIEDRKDPDMKEWEKKRDELIEQFELQEWQRSYRGYTSTLCKEALKSKDIEINVDIVTPPTKTDVTNKGNPTKNKIAQLIKSPKYAPCRSLAF